ncbi:MAG: geranylgeranylglyceryl/heptaprenylglyceryl phosphate synthase [Bacteroidota bacterium]
MQDKQPTIYTTIYNQSLAEKKLFGLLIDPENYSFNQLERTVKAAEVAEVDFFLVGGSLVSTRIDTTLTAIKQLTKRPVILFPGSPMQISFLADGILFLSLISGRNPDFLIGNHVVAAPYLRKTNLEIIPTGYILVGGGGVSSVEYMSNTRPIPVDKPDIAVATALAGEMPGQKLIYLESGSGAGNTVPEELVRCVKKAVSIPVIVGGGVRTGVDVKNLYQAGADIVVVGNAVEENYELLLELTDVVR